MLEYFRNKRVMTFLAHPDDETLGCGATLARAVREGAGIYCVIPVKRIEKQCEKVMDILGVAELHWGKFDDNQMDKYPLLNVCKFLERYVREIKPDILITHHHACANQDHRVCYEAASVVAKPVKGQIQLISCEIPSSTGYLRPSNFEPNLYVGLSYKEMNIKLACVEAYQTELRGDRGVDVIDALGTLRGAESGNKYAEGFMQVRHYV